MLLGRFVANNSSDQDRKGSVVVVPAVIELRYKEH
jgi:hypothetical protein